MKGELDVTITQGEEYKVAVTIDSSIVDAVIVRIQDNVCEIYLDQEECYTDYEASIIITAPTLTTIEAHGSGDHIVEKFSEQSNLTFDISGSGSISCTALSDIENITTKISGSGSIEFKDIFSCSFLNAKIDGSGDIKAFHVTANTCQAVVNGSGDMELSVVENLNATVNGSGSISYKGDPSAITTIVNGSGDIRKVD
jgi:hypothetical protein